MKAVQQHDNDKKEYCEVQFDQADDKKKALERTEGKHTASIEDAKETTATLTAEIKGHRGSGQELRRGHRELRGG